MTKKILLTIASLFLALQSYKLLSNIEWVTSDSLAITIFAAWIINMFVTGVFAFAVFAWPVESLLPPSYYKIYEPKRLKKIFKVLKVESFRKLLLATLWKSTAQRQKHFNGKLDGINNLELQSKKSEFGHIFPFVILLLVSIYIMMLGFVLLGISVYLINIIGNLYPVILQRHHRMRIQILRKRYSRLKKQ